MSPEAVQEESPAISGSDQMLTELEVAEIFCLVPKELAPFRKAGILKGESYRERWWQPFRLYRYSLHQLLRLSQALYAPNGVYQVSAHQLPSDWKHPHFSPDLWTVENAQYMARLPMAIIVDSFLSRAVTLRATEILIEAQRRATSVRFRVKGKLSEPLNVPKEAHKSLLHRIKLIAGLNPLWVQTSQYAVLRANFPFEDSWSEYGIQINTLPTYYGENASLHVIYPTPLTEETPLPDELMYLLYRTDGLLLLSGPRGTDITTILRDVLRELASYGRSVLLIEKEQAFPIEGVLQTFLDPERGFREPEAVRSALRQGAEVVAFANLSSKEAAEAALHATESGALVLACLRTRESSVLSAYQRFVLLGVPSQRVARLLSGIVALSQTPEGTQTSETLTLTDELRTLLATHPQNRERVFDVEWAVRRAKKSA